MMGEEKLNIGLLIIGIIISLFLLYLVIRTAVKDGINKSIIGQYYEVNMERC